MRLPHFFTRTADFNPKQSGRGSTRDLRNDSRRSAPCPARSTRPGRGRTGSGRFNSRGFAALGGCLALLATIAGVGLVNILFDLEIATRNQVNLDRCTGDFIIHARAAGITMEKSYSRVKLYQKATRLACASVAACPEAEALLTTAMTGEAVIERVVEAYWSEQKTVWDIETSAHCNLPWGTRMSSFPSFPFEIIQPELGLAEYRAEKFFVVGVRPLQLRLNTRRQASTAQLERRSENVWKIRWTE